MLTVSFVLSLRTFALYRMNDLIKVVLLVYSCVGLVHNTDCPDREVAFQGSCYLFGHGVSMTFVEAEHFCNQHGGHVVEVYTHTENLFIKDFLRNVHGGCYWNGLTDENVEGIWVWYSSNTSPRFIDWGRNDPNGGNAADCVVFYDGSSYDYQWADISCSAKCRPVCKIGGGTGVIVGKR